MPIGDYPIWTSPSSHTQLEYAIAQLVQLLHNAEATRQSNQWREQQAHDSVIRLAYAVESIAASMKELSADLLQKAYEKATEDLKRLLESQNDSTERV